MLHCVACKEKRNKLTYITYILSHGFIYDFINCPAFVDIKQILHYKLAVE